MIGDLNDIEPIKAAQQEAAVFWKRLRERVADWGWKTITASLVKVTLPSVAGVALATIALPWFAAAVCVVAIVLLLVHAVYATRLLKRKDAELRWAWVANNRLQQQLLDHEIATDDATLELMGERVERRPQRFVPRDLRAALAHVRAKALAAERAAAQAQQSAASAPGGDGAARARRPPKADRRSARPPVIPEGPDLAVVKARKAKREAEHAAREAEIQSWATPQDIDRARAVADRQRTARERMHAAMEADQAARERARRGLQPTAEDTEHTIEIAATPNGGRDVRTGRGAPTPEQIARGLAEGRSSGDL